MGTLHIKNKTQVETWWCWLIIDNKFLRQRTVVDYISYYNKNKIQQKLDYQSLIEYRQAAA